ncbi:hypothetical protein PHYPSEUDO_004576 [Phytophthora pseudosyringae]|uniref:Uncharacterized protein n=1 Tax=Phytophthora pseudosyringae TaxID=221518 RepID=A0A8T1WDN7_9STRA|nr:hypothetical protein PHYPSEUDO_004576 [Phytophthora pseudosyringae]
MLLSRPVELLPVATEDEPLPPLVDALPPRSELLVEDVPVVELDDVLVLVQELEELAVEVVEFALRSAVLELLFVPDEALVLVVEVSDVAVAPFDEPAAVLVAEAAAVVLDPEVPELVEAVAALFVLVPVTDDPVVVDTAFSVALFVDPEATAVNAVVESEVADPAVPETMMAELAAPSVAVALAADPELIVWVLVVGGVEEPEVTDPDVVTWGFDGEASTVVAVVVVAVAVLEAALDPPETSVAAPAKLLVVVVEAALEVSEVTAPEFVAVTPAELLAIVAAASDAWGLDVAVASGAVEILEVVDEVPALDPPEVAVLEEVPEVVEVVALLEVVEVPATTADPLVTAPVQFSRTITVLPWASCSKRKVEHVVCAETLDAASRANTSDAMIFMAVTRKSWLLVA